MFICRSFYRTYTGVTCPFPSPDVLKNKNAWRIPANKVVFPGYGPTSANAVLSASAALGCLQLYPVPSLTHPLREPSVTVALFLQLFHAFFCKSDVLRVEDDSERIIPYVEWCFVVILSTSAAMHLTAWFALGRSPEKCQRISQEQRSTVAATIPGEHQIATEETGSSALEKIWDRHVKYKLLLVEPNSKKLPKWCYLHFEQRFLVQVPLGKAFHPSGAGNLLQDLSGND